MHTLVKLDSGKVLWFLTEILREGDVPMERKEKRSLGKKRQVPKRERVMV